MTPIKEAICKILLVDKFCACEGNHDEYIDHCEDCPAHKLESLIPALVEMVNAALALRTREAADACYSKEICRVGCHAADKAAILALIKPDESAALEKREGEKACGAD